MSIFFTNDFLYTKTIFIMLLLIFRSPFIQYVPQKPAKFGIKFWMLCDATTYHVLRAFPYVGKEEDRVSTGLGEFVTLSLLKPYRNAGLNATCDNFFKSLSCKKTLATTYNNSGYHHRTSKRNSEWNLLWKRCCSLFIQFFLYIATLEHHDTQLQNKKNKVVLLLSSEHSTVEVHEGEKRKPKATLD